MKRYEYDAVLHENADDGGAWVAFPRNLCEEFGRGRVKVHASFDGIPYDGSVVNMGLKNGDGSVCYVLGVRKAIRQQLGKADGDTIRVTVEIRADEFICSACGLPAKSQAPAARPAVRR